MYINFINQLKPKPMLFSTHRVAVVGSRSRIDKEYIHRKLNELHAKKPIDLIVSGGARGVDMIAEDWAFIKGITTKIFLPEWNVHGKKAGFIRNKDIVNNADVVYAFWDGESKGTASSIQLALEKRLEVIVDIPEEE